VEKLGDAVVPNMFGEGLCLLPIEWGAEGEESHGVGGERSCEKVGATMRMLVAAGGLGWASDEWTETGRAETRRDETRRDDTGERCSCSPRYMRIWRIKRINSGEAQTNRPSRSVVRRALCLYGYLPEKSDGEDRSVAPRSASVVPLPMCMLPRGEWFWIESRE
jgi:hypothetical protein